MEGDAETADTAPPGDRKPLFLPVAMGRAVLHQALHGACLPGVRRGGSFLVDNGNYN